MERGRKGREPVILARFNRRRTGGASRKHHQRVGCRRIPVHRDRIESLVGNVFQQILQQIGIDRCVGEDIGQHGRHVRCNHARALGDACKGSWHPRQINRPTGRLGIGVGGHEGACAGLPVGRRQPTS